MELPLLSIILFLPVIGAIVIGFLDARKERQIQIVGIFTSVLTFLFTLPMWKAFEAAKDFQFVEKYEWIPSLGISYYLGVDGLSLLLIVMTTVLSPLVLLASASQIKKRVKEFYISFLFLITGMIGAFMALDLFLFYIFWEVMLIPMYFIIGIWGGKRRIYATVKFFIYTMAGSLFMLLAILYVGYQGKTFSLTSLGELTSTFDLTTQLILFGAFALSFAIKVPTVPFHTWLPDAHVEAPTGGSVILAGVLLKMGIYGFLRFCFPLFPAAVVAVAPYMCAIGVIGIIYGAFLAYAQEDLKKLVAYSSISHLGFCVLGVFSLSETAVNGGIYQMLNHGVSTGALFLLVGIIYERRHTREISEYGGIASVVPVYATIFMIILLASVGLPGLNGFVGEFLILIGSFQSFPYLTAIATLGVVFGAVYMLSMYRRVFFGSVTKSENEELEDVTKLEFVTLLPLVVLVFVMGIVPNFFLREIEPTANKLVQDVKATEKKVSPVSHQFQSPEDKKK